MLCGHVVRSHLRSTGPLRGPGRLKWRRHQNEFVLSWGDRDFATRPEKARGRWFASNLDDAAIGRVAKLVARNLNWQCTHREIDLTDEQVPLIGSGGVSVSGGYARRLEVHGQLKICLPNGVEVVESLDVNSFRRMVATESGPVPDLPVPYRDSAQFEARKVPGLVYVRDFINAEEEQDLITTLDACNWDSDLQRRVQHYGWRYDYRARLVDSSMRLGPLPEWASRIAQRLVSEGLLHVLPDQVIVNEYVANQGITRHVDSVPSFADGIAMISLLESWGMVFRERRGRREG